MEGIMIKEAAKMLDVEAHVLRYWEEELGIEIKRNSMGHRYYDDRDIKLFNEVKQLKARGLSLKDIRAGIEKLKGTAGIDEIQPKPQPAVRETDDTNTENTADNTAGAEDRNEPAHVDDVKVVDFKLAQMQTIMNKVIANALRENKEIITSSIKAEITEDVMRQFDTVMREKEEREEARFKKLDECLRQMQRANEEAAATRVKRRWGRRK